MEQVPLGNHRTHQHRYAFRRQRGILLKIKEAFEPCGFNLRIHSNINQLIWEKLMTNISLSALTAARFLLENGYKIPQDIAVFGLNNSPYSEYSFPKIFSIDNKLTELSKACVKILDKAMRKKGYIEKIVIPSTLVIKETT